MDRLVKLRMKQPKPVMRQMVAAVLLGQLNIDQAAERYKVNRMTVLRWIRKIEEEAKASKQAASDKSDQPPPRKRASTKSSPQQNEAEVNQLRVKLRSLEEELEIANFKALYYSTLVRVAKHELGVDIEKKSVTKPSGLC
ncbi:hypothetical protein [Spirosoma arcticum]